MVAEDHALVLVDTGGFCKLFLSPMADSREIATAVTMVGHAKRITSSSGMPTAATSSLDFITWIASIPTVARLR